MINFRYHVVSLVGIFLALGLGIIVGSNVIDQGIIGQLENDTKGLQKLVTDLRIDKDDLNRQLQVWDQFGTALLPELVRGKLNGRTVALVVQEGVEGRAVDELAATLVQAGAAKPSRLTLTRKWMLVDDAARNQLATLTGETSTTKAALLRAAGSRLGRRLGSGGDPRGDSDLIRRLDDAGFLRLADVPRGTFPEPGSLVIALAAGDPTLAPPADDLLVPLVEALAANRPLVAGEPLGAKDSLTDKVRAERDLAELVPTVDHANTWPGRLSLVWALRDLLDGGDVSHYGVHRGTDGVAPAVA